MVKIPSCGYGIFFLLLEHCLQSRFEINLYRGFNPQISFFKRFFQFINQINIYETHSKYYFNWSFIHGL